MRLAVSLTAAAAVWAAGLFCTGCAPYSPDSPFNRPVGPDPTPTPNGDAMVRRVLGFSSSTDGPGAIVLDNPMGESSHARYHASASDPLYRVDMVNSWCTRDGDVIRIPKGATPAGGWNRTDWSGWDGHMYVTQPRDADGVIWEYDFYQGRSITDGNPGTIRADCGGREDVENGDGLTDYSATVANFALAAGQVIAQNLRDWPDPEIGHALFMSVPCSNGQHVPWLTTSGAGAPCADRTNAPPLGQRFYLDYTDSEIDRLPAATRPFVQALADYGMYFGDTGGPADFGLHATLEASHTYASFGKPNPINDWAASVGLPKNTAGKYVLRLNSPHVPIDWTRLKAIEP